MKLVINAVRSSYSNDCKSMTVGELIRFLEDYYYDTEVLLKFDNGYTYGSLSCDSFELESNQSDSDEDQSDSDD